MKKNSDAKALIRQMAQDAKSRMLQRKYGDRFENQALKRCIDKNNNIKLYVSKKPDISISIIENDKDEEFKNKVFELLNNNEDVINPIYKLIDKNTFDSMTEFEKERTILEISERYVNLKNQYYSTY